jgi:hypothetical protein
MAQGTHCDLVVCFTWKQVGIGFPSLALILADSGWRVMHVTPSWRLCRDQIEDGRIDITGCV